MKDFLNTLWLILLGLIVPVTMSCSQPPPIIPGQNASSTIAPTPVVTPAKALPWAESFGRFYTRDVNRAQEQIPFKIILPSYIPDKLKDGGPPDLTGPLKGYQYEGKVQISILYLPKPTEEARVSIEIHEGNYPVIPPDPKLNPEYVYIEINGNRVVKREDNFQRGHGVIFSFNRDNFYFDLGIYNFSMEEALKVLKSMLE